MKTISATVQRGPNKGVVLKPHRFGDGNFAVSKGGKGGNLRARAERVTNESDLESWVSLGYGIRMSAVGVAPSLYMPKSLVVSTQT